MPTIKKTRPNGNVVYIKEDGSHTELDPTGNVVTDQPATIPDQVHEPDKLGAFGQGMISGATFGVKGNEPNALPGSVLTKKTPGEKLARIGGQVVGSIPAAAAMAATSEVTVPALMAKWGMSEVVAARVAAAMAASGYAGIEGAVQNKPPLETGKNMLYAGAMGTAAHGVGEAASAVKGALTKDLTEQMAADFYNVPKNIAEEATMSGQPTVGRKALDNPDFSGMQSRKTVFNKARTELWQRENQIQGLSDQYAENARTPHQPDVVNKGTYDPIQKKYVRPQIDYTPAGKQEVIPGGESPTPPPGKGETVHIGDSIQTTQPGGSTYDTMTPRGTFVDYSGKSAQTPPAQPGQNFADAARSLNEPERFSFKGVKKDPAIYVSDIADEGQAKAVLDPLIEEYGRNFGANDSRYRTLVQFRETGAGDIGLVNKVRRILDDVVNTYYEKPMAVMPTSTKAAEEMANRARAVIGERSPELATMLADQHDNLLRIRSLLPTVGTRGSAQLSDLNFVSRIERDIKGTSGYLGAATALDKAGNVLSNPNVGQAADIATTAAAGKSGKYATKFSDAIDNARKKQEKK